MVGGGVQFLVYVVSLAGQAGLDTTFTETRKTGFLALKPKFVILTNYENYIYTSSQTEQADNR